MKIGCMKIGFIINPISGMGGKVGLKGTDRMHELALELGGEPVSQKRAEEALRGIADPDIFFLTCSGKMGEDALKKTRFKFEIIYETLDVTSAEDTMKAARKMLESGCDLILFSGGDGTACDIASVVDLEIPVLGIPAGVKIFSPVFGATPEETGRIVSTFLETATGQVLDIDEEAYRRGEMNVRVKCEVRIPVSPGIQRGKEPSGAVDAKTEIAERIIDDIRAGSGDVLLIIAPGTTTMEVKKRFGIEGTLLGVDVIRNGKIIKKDAREKDILAAIKAMKEAKGDGKEKGKEEGNEKGKIMIIVSPIGSQGFIFGRGNQQISPEVIRSANEIKVIASPDKLEFTPLLRVDTGDSELDKKLRGYVKVLCGYRDFRMMRVV